MAAHLIEVNGLHRYTTERRPAYDELDIATIVSTAPVQTAQHFFRVISDITDSRVVWDIKNFHHLAIPRHIQGEACRVEKTTGTATIFSLDYFAKVKLAECWSMAFSWPGGLKDWGDDSRSG